MSHGLSLGAKLSNSHGMIENTSRCGLRTRSAFCGSVVFVRAVHKTSSC
jgi:hypothetical protein